MRGSVLVVLLAFIIQSCVDCGPQQELSVEIRFMGDSVGIDSIFAVNALDNQIFQNEAENLTGMHRSVTLPISMHADSTTFVFVSGDKSDSLTVFYNRVFRYKGDCGFIVDAGQPVKGPQSRSTFETVNVHYEPYVFSGTVTFVSGGPASGILIDVKP